MSGSQSLSSKLLTTNNSNNTSSQSISIMRNYQNSVYPQQQQQQQQQQQSLKSSMPTSRSLFTGLPTNSSSSSSSSVHSTSDHPYSLSSTLHPKYHENFWHCSGCQDVYKDDRAQILSCFHSMCEICIEKYCDHENETIICPLCGFSSLLTEILPDYTRQTNHSPMADDYSLALGTDVYTQHCTACKTSESMAVAKCFQCSSFLCHQCVCAHQIMNCFEGHQVS